MNHFYSKMDDQIIQKLLGVASSQRYYSSSFIYHNEKVINILEVAVDLQPISMCTGRTDFDFIRIGCKINVFPVSYCKYCNTTNGVAVKTMVYGDVWYVKTMVCGVATNLNNVDFAAGPQ